MNDIENPVVARTIADHTYQHIRRDIITGKLAPGLKLGMEMLSKRYDVGLSPLREALVKLTGDALVIAEGQRGFWVTQISTAELEDTMATRLLIETEALSLSIERGDAEWERAVRDSYAELTALERELDGADAATFARWEQANRRFHEALVSACGSPWLIRLRNMLHRHAERYRMISLSQTKIERDVHDEHEAIVEAVLSRKTLRACRLTELHLQRTTEIVRAALERKQGEDSPRTARRGRTRGDSGKRRRTV
jgi:GntR family transcriptional regulator, carbon starvation induced regulator